MILNSVDRGMGWPGLLLPTIFVLLLASSGFTMARGCEENRGAEGCSELSNELSAEAEFRIGVDYSTGAGGIQDSVKALQWIRSAAERGHAYAQFNLGEAYATGTGVARDYKRAVKWLILAAQSDVSDAQVSLGLKYDSGLGVAQDKREAVKWFRRAAERGNPYGQNNLAIAYALGDGVSQNRVKAYAWFEIAIINGSGVSRESSDQLSLTMSSSELLEAKRLVEQWHSPIK